MSINYTATEATCAWTGGTPPPTPPPAPPVVQGTVFLDSDFPKHWHGTEIIQSNGYNADIDYFADLFRSTVMPFVIETFTSGTIVVNDVLRTFVIDNATNGTNEIYAVKAKFRARSSASTFKIDINGTQYLIFEDTDVVDAVKTINIAPPLTANAGDQIVVKVADNSGGYDQVTLALFAIRTLKLTEGTLVHAKQGGTPFQIVVDGPVFGANLDELWNRLNQLTYAMIEFSWYRRTPTGDAMETFIGVAKKDITISTVYVIVGSGTNTGSQTYDLQQNGVTVQTITVSGIVPPGYSTVTLTSPISLKEGDKLSLVPTSVAGSQRDVSIQLEPLPLIHDC